MDEQNKHRSGRKFDDTDIIDVEDNLSPPEDQELEQETLVDDEPVTSAPKRRTGLVAGVVLASLAVVGGGY